MKTLRSTGRAIRRAGFTLIELIAVIVIIGLLMAAVIPGVVAAIGGGEVAACQGNLKSINEGMLLFKAKYNRLPKKAGVGFFASLVSEGIWKPSMQNTKRLNCPAIQLDSLDPSLDGIPEKDWYARSNRDQWGSGWSSYAGRDTRRKPIRKMQGSGDTALVADDNEFEGNHSTTTNVLWDDFTIQSLELYELMNDGVMVEDESVTFIPVGPDSPVEGLQSLTIDE